MTGIYEKYRSNIIFKNKGIDCFFPLRWRTRQGYLLSPHLFNIILESLVRAMRQENKIRRLIISGLVKDVEGLGLSHIPGAM